MDGVLARYGEIGIKSVPVKRRMTAVLRQNILDLLLARGVEGNAELRGTRIWMTGPDADALLDIATHTFGITSATPCRLVPSTIEDIGEVAAELALESQWTSFAIRARRDGAHEFSSQDVAVQVGSIVWKAAEAAGREVKVDLDNPDLEIIIEVRGERAYVGMSTTVGPGGLPMKSQGRVVALISDTPSAIAAWLMMRRGCGVVPVHAGDMGSAPVEILEPLQSWGLTDEIDTLPVCSGTVSKKVLLDAAAQLAKRTKSQAVVTGDTLTSDLTRGDFPVLRPVCGLPPKVLESYAQRIGLPAHEGESIFSESSTETLQTLMSMHRKVTV